MSTVQVNLMEEAVISEAFRPDGALGRAEEEHGGGGTRRRKKTKEREMVSRHVLRGKNIVRNGHNIQCFVTTAKTLQPESADELKFPLRLSSANCCV